MNEIKAYSNKHNWLFSHVTSFHQHSCYCITVASYLYNVTRGVITSTSPFFARDYLSTWNWVKDILYHKAHSHSSKAVTAKTYWTFRPNHQNLIWSNMAAVSIGPVVPYRLELMLHFFFIFHNMHFLTCTTECKACHLFSFQNLHSCISINCHIPGDKLVYSKITAFGNNYRVNYDLVCPEKENINFVIQVHCHSLHSFHIILSVKCRKCPGKRKERKT